jgi:defect in organelle trafficking protein DotC
VPHRKTILIAILGGTMLSGCAQLPVPMDPVPRVSSETQLGDPSSPARFGTQRVAVNEGRKHLASITKVKAPTLNDLINAMPAEDELGEEATEEDKLRRPAIRDTALSYGARGGLAHASYQINRMLQGRADKLDQIYDFQPLMIRGPDNLMVLPPVIVEAKETYELTGGAKSVRIADQVYEIAEQAKFAPVAPMWHTYLIREYTAPKDPPSEILPKTPEERAYWERYVREGWEIGLKQANDIFEADLRRLDRDHAGMMRYTRLLAEGKVNAPIIGRAPMGVTGDGQSMRVNDRSVMITLDPRFEINPANWTPTVVSGPPSEYSRPAGSGEVRDYPYGGDREY